VKDVLLHTRHISHSILKLQTITQDICMPLLADRSFITWGRCSALI